MAAVLRTMILLGLVGSAVLGFYLVIASSIPSFMEGAIAIMSFPGEIIIFVLETLKVNISHTADGILKSVTWMLLLIGIGLVADRN